MQTFRAELQTLGHEVMIIAPAYPQPTADGPGIERIASRRVPFDPEDRMMRPRALARPPHRLRHPLPRPAHWPKQAKLG